MKRIMIFGTGKTAYNVVNCLGKNINIVAYIDNDKSKVGYKDSYPVVTPVDIKKFKYDYIIIASQYEEEIFQQLKELNIDEMKIIKFFKWFDSNNNYVEDLIRVYNNSCDYRGIITGISYTRAAIIESLLKYKFVLAAFASQDLKYDYKISEYIIENRRGNQIDYCIIGLNYYSFQYDLSKSSMKNKIDFYNCIDSDKNTNNYDFTVENMIFKKDYCINFNQETEFCKMENDLKSEIGKKQALLDCNKNYPETVKENKQILKDYFNLLKNNKIKPIVIVCPASEYYTKYFSKKIEDEFHSIINEFEKEYDFQYIDYFRSKEFDDKYFQDVSHLTPEGAVKFTKILNNLIKW